MISPLILSGLIVRNVEYIKTNLAKEYWVATLIRLETEKTFILAVIEDLEGLYSHSNLQNVLRNFLLNKVFLWPACRFEVQKSLVNNNTNENQNNNDKDDKDKNPHLEESADVHIKNNENQNQAEICNENTEESAENKQFLKENKEKIKEILEEKNKSFPVKTFEVYLKLSPLMRKIQDSLLRIMEKIRLEINRIAAKSSSFNNEKHSISFEDLTSLNYRGFYRKLFNLKELKQKSEVFLENLKDLLSFKRLLQDLVNSDACKFLRKLENIREEAGNQSIWCLGDDESHKELNKLMKFSKQRVYDIIANEENSEFFEFKLSQEEFINVSMFENKPLTLNEGNQKFPIISNEQNPEKEIKNPNNNNNNKFIEFQLKNQVKLNLEINPKLEVLRKTLEKISEKLKHFPEKKGVIWIHANSEEKVKEISDFLNSSFYRKDLQILNMCRKFLFFLNNPSSRNSRYSRILELIKKNIKTSEFSSQNIEDLLLEEKRQNFSEFLDNLREIEIISTKEENLNLYKELFKDFAEKQGFQKNLDFSQILIDKFDDQGNREFQKDAIILDCEVLINNLKRTAFRDSFLHKFKPKFIVLFEPNLSLIREILVYQKYSGTIDISLHILMFQNTIESSEYIQLAKRENRLFERVIRDTKNLIEITETAKDRIKKLEFNNSYSQNSTRIGGINANSNNINKKSIIIIDKREFHHSTLPAKLFFSGFTVIPRFLEKGDYILSDDIAIERKSVASGDLLESLKSGRLDKQAKKMNESFKKTGLLIEFSEDWKFSFESLSKTSMLQEKSSSFSITNNNNNYEEENLKGNRSGICFMLSVLVMKYPNFNVFWSKGNENTAKLFSILKKNQKEPDPNKYLPKGEEKEEEYGELNFSIKVNGKEKEEDLVIGGNLISGGDVDGN